MQGRDKISNFKEILIQRAGQTQTRLTHDWKQPAQPWMHRGMEDGDFGMWYKEHWGQEKRESSPISPTHCWSYFTTLTSVSSPANEFDPRGYSCPN